jgi:hypothetical protein
MIRIGENFNKEARFSPEQVPDRPRPFSRLRQDGRVGRDHCGGLTEMIRPRSSSEPPRGER